MTDVLVDDLSARRLIVRGKGDKVRAVVIGVSTARALRKYLQWRSQSQYASLDALWLGNGAGCPSRAWTGSSAK